MYQSSSNNELSNESTEVVNLLPEIDLNQEKNEILQALNAPQKRISSKYFYNKKGSEFFEQITGLPEYYPSRTEKDILKEIAPQIMGNLKGFNIIELGSGDCSKISILLDAVTGDDLRTMQYIPVDFSESAIIKSANILSRNYPGIAIKGVVADFIHHTKMLADQENKLICFLGSTLGNLERHEAKQFLLDVKTLMQPGDQLLLGLDMVKNVQILEDAYNDKQGVTQKFNKNIFSSINELIGTTFNSDLFSHRAFFNNEKARVEMHLEAIERMQVHTPLQTIPITIEKGETIHTENSHKFTTSDIHEFASITGLKVKQIFSDSNQWFSLAWFKYE